MKTTLTQKVNKQDSWRKTIAYIVGRKKAEECLGFLVEAGKVLSEHTSFYKTLPNLAELAVPFLGDWFSVDLLFNRGQVHNITEKSLSKIDDGYRKKLGQAFRPCTMLDAAGNRKILLANKTTLYTENPKPSANQPESILSNLGVRSALIIPLELPKGRIGAIEILSTKIGEDRKYGPADLALAEELGRRVSLAIERSLLYDTGRRANEHSSTLNIL